MKTISLTGFSGGRSKKIADINLHIDSKNYGIIESLHHTVMNLISQYLKNKYFSLKEIKLKKVLRNKFNGLFFTSGNYIIIINL